MNLIQRKTGNQQSAVLQIVLSVFSVGESGTVQRSLFRIVRMRCIVMDTWPGRSSVLNHRRIRGPRLCLRQDPKQSRERSGYYSAAPVVMEASPARCHTLTAGPSHTQYRSALPFHPPLPPLPPDRREDFRRFARSIP